VSVSLSVPMSSYSRANCRICKRVLMSLIKVVVVVGIKAPKHLSTYVCEPVPLPASPTNTPTDSPSLYPLPNPPVISQPPTLPAPRVSIPAASAPASQIPREARAARLPPHFHAPHPDPVPSPSSPGSWARAVEAVHLNVAPRGNSDPCQRSTRGMTESHPAQMELGCRRPHRPPLALARLYKIE
jgi:hypothetical protein